MFSEPHRKTKYFLQPHRIALAQSLLFANDWSHAKSIILNYQRLCSLFFFVKEKHEEEGNYIFLPREIFIFRQWIQFQVSYRNKINPIWNGKVLCCIGETTTGMWYYLWMVGVFLWFCADSFLKKPQLSAFFSQVCVTMHLGPQTSNLIFTLKWNLYETACSELLLPETSSYLQVVKLQPDSASA